MSGDEVKQPKQRTRGVSKKNELPVFVTKAGIARMLSVGNTKTIDAWIANGSFPPPHSRPGERHAVWLKKHWQTYVDTGEWPREAFRKV